MTITFDKRCKPFISKALGTLRGRNCCFCGVPLNQKNWAGAQKPLGFFCNSITCLIELVQYHKKNSIINLYLNKPA